MPYRLFALIQAGVRPTDLPRVQNALDFFVGYSDHPFFSYLEVQQ